MNIVYMGTPEIAATVLDSIIASGKHNILAVVTQPDKPKGRGHEVQFSEVKELALKNNLEVLQPLKANDPGFMERMKELNPDIIVVTAYGKILKKELLELPRMGCINVHASLLPKYRGASPIQQAVIDGEEKSGVTIMYMAEGVDTGDMIAKKEVMLDRKETAGSLHDKLAVAGGELIVEVLEDIAAGTAVRTPQNDAEATHVSMIDKSFGKIRFNESAGRIERLVRGLNPWPSAFTYLDGKLLKIWDADVIDELPKSFADTKEGTIIAVNKDNFLVKTGEDTALQINILQLEGKKRMTTEEFMRGYKLETGVILG